MSPIPREATMDTPVTEAMAERFERLEARCNHLERQVRRWRRREG